MRKLGNAFFTPEVTGTLVRLPPRTEILGVVGMSAMPSAGVWMTYSAPEDEMNTTQGWKTRKFHKAYSAAVVPDNWQHIASVAMNPPPLPVTQSVMSIGQTMLFTPQFGIGELLFLFEDLAYNG